MTAFNTTLVNKKTKHASAMQKGPFHLLRTLITNPSCCGLGLYYCYSFLRTL